MTEHVTVTEIADLIRRIRHLSEQRPADPLERAAVLTLKADLLNRIANQRAHEWGPCEYTTQARTAADQAQAIAANANRLLHTHQPPAGGAKSQENPPPS